MKSNLAILSSDQKSIDFIKKNKLSSTLNKKAEAPEANANGTSGYLIKEGPNAGKILKHLKTDRSKL